MTVKSSISLTDQQAAFAKSLVKEGHYPSLSSVLQHGLDLLHHEIEARALETEALRTLLKQRQDGAFVASSDMQKTIKKVAARKRRGKNL